LRKSPFRAGFKSLSRFYEAFTSRFGMSPNRYRRHYKQVHKPAASAPECLLAASGLVWLQQVG
jgi:hypothetical protein